MDTSLSSVRLTRRSRPAAWLRSSTGSAPDRLRRVQDAVRQSPAIQACVVGVLLCCVLPFAYDVAGISASLAKATVLSAAAAATFWYLRRVLAIGVWIALPFSIVFLYHPLSAAMSVGDSTVSATLPMLLVPLVAGLSHLLVTNRDIRLAMVLGGLLGVGLVVDRVGGGAMVGLSLTLLLSEALITQKERGGSRFWRRFALHLAVAAALCAVVALAAPGVLSHFGIDMADGVEHAPPAHSVISAPLALVDRDGLLASRLSKLPDDLTGGGACYLGWPIIVLCLVAVWPGSCGDRRRRAAGLVMLVLALTWLIRGDASLHVQLQRLFEFATVKRYVEPLTLHLLGLLVVPLLLLVTSGFLAAARLVTRRNRLTFPAVVFGSTVVMAWWATSPADVTPSGVSLSSALAGSQTTKVLMAFLLVAVAATGLRRVWVGLRTRRWRAALWLIAFGVLAIDCRPYMLAAIHEASAAHVANNAEPHARNCEEGRECAQVTRASCTSYQGLAAQLPTPCSGRVQSDRPIGRSTSGHKIQKTRRSHLTPPLYRV